MDLGTEKQKLANLSSITQDLGVIVGYRRTRMNLMTLKVLGSTLVYSLFSSNLQSWTKKRIEYCVDSVK